MEVSRTAAEITGPGVRFPVRGAEMRDWSRGCPGGHQPNHPDFNKYFIQFIEA